MYMVRNGTASKRNLTKTAISLGVHVLHPLLRAGHLESLHLPGNQISQCVEGCSVIKPGKVLTEISSVTFSSSLHCPSPELCDWLLRPVIGLLLVPFLALSPQMWPLRLDCVKRSSLLFAGKARTQPCRDASGCGAHILHMQSVASGGELARTL